LSELIYLGIDIGTTSAKCLAVDSQGTTLAFAQHPYPMSHPREGWAEQDPEDFWKGLKNVVRRCITELKSLGHDSSSIRALAMSTQGDTLIVADQSGCPVIPAISWMDMRAQEECQELLAERDQRFWYEETGLMLTPYSSACKIRWLSRHKPEVFADPSIRFYFVPDFLTARLTGKFVTDVPSASWQPMFSPRERAISENVLNLIGIAREKIAEPVESGTHIGELLPNAAQELGISCRTQVIAGAFDQAAAAHGAEAKAGERSILSCGTAWVLYSVTSSPIRDETNRLPICCHTSFDKWGLVLPFTGGAAYDWLNRTIGSETDKASDSEPPVFIPHLYGGLCPDWRGDSRGSLVALTMSHTQEDIRLALMRGIAFETRRNVEAAERIGAEIVSVRMVGGAGKSKIWPQMIANILDRPVEVSNLTESACYGAAKLAAGVGSEWSAAESEHKFVPVPEQVKFEDRQYRRYLHFYEALLEAYGNA
jgi:xylulokinase